jgi:LPXTG-motif cell wall-anchored protein
VANQSAGATTATTLAEPATLPFTGENAVLVAVLGAGIAGAGVLVRRRIERC